MNWQIAAVLSALFAALTSILAKIGVKNIDSNLATAIRASVILIFTWGIIFFEGTTKEVFKLGKISVIFLVLSGLTTGLSWLFYFKALQTGPVSKVVPIDRLSLVLTLFLAALLLKEKVTLISFLGATLMVVGAIMMATVK